MSPTTATDRGALLARGAWHAPAPAMNAIEILAAARRLVAAGLPLVPCCAPLDGGRCSAPWHKWPCDRIGKRPLAEGYPEIAHEPPTVEHVERELRRLGAVNPAIVTGPIVAVEADSAEAEAEVVELAGPEIERAPCRLPRPGRGRGWLFAAPPGVEIGNRAGLGRSGAIDVRGRSGIFVVPPSVHATGHRYQWAPSRAPWEIELPPLPVGLLALAIDGAETRRRAADAVGRLSRPEIVAHVPPRVGALLRAEHDLGELWAGRGKRSGDCSGSGYDYAIAVALLRRGVPEREIASALAARPGAHRRDTAYLRTTVERAAARGKARR